MALIYTTDFGGREMKWTEQEFMPYLIYFDKNLQPVPGTKMFDAFLMLAGARTVNNEPHSFSNKYETGFPSDLNDWRWLMGKFFDEKGSGLNALNTASADLGIISKVVIIIPYPERDQHNPGTVDGRELDFGRLGDRFTAVSYWIDSIVKQWNKKNYSNLRLTGFYWMDEVMFEFFGKYGDNTDETLLSRTRDYLHSIKVKGEWMRFFWIPSNLNFVVDDMGGENSPWKFDADGRDIFDTVIFQPNYMQGYFDWRSYKTLKEVAQVAYNNGFGVEMEFNECIYSDKDCLSRSLDYFTAGENYGFNKSVQAFVFGNTQLSKMVNEKHSLYKTIYDYINDIQSP